jgi:RNA polymerase sigma-70 factor (ECF subfamily)
MRKEMRDLEDEELVVLCQEGNREAFAELVTRYKGMVFTMIHRVLNRPWQAEDVAQEIFLRAFKAMPGFRRESKFSTWLYRICYNFCVTTATKRNPENTYEATIPIAATVETNYERKELQEKIRQLISELPPAYSAAITLRHIHGLSYAEIAEILGQPLGTTKSTISRARAHLRKLVLEKIGWDGVKDVL